MNWNTDGYVKIQSNPLYTTRSGNFYGGSFQAQASYGLLWSGTTGSGTFAYLLSYYSSNVRPALYDNRYYGFPVRCITRDFNFLLVQYGIAVNYVGSGTATWSDNGYSNIQNKPIYTTRSGFFYSSSFDHRASLGYLWSGTSISGTNAYYLLYNSSDVSPASYSNRQIGFPVRCIARHFYIIIQKKNQDMCLFFFSC